MIKNYVPSQYHTEERYELVFDDGRNNGFGFPCDKEGNLLPNDNPCAIDNYHYCLENSDIFERFNEVVTYRYRVKENAHGTCHCGREIELFDQYCGACECDCGQWYNLFGEEILSPSEWQEDIDYDY